MENSWVINNEWWENATVFYEDTSFTPRQKEIYGWYDTGTWPNGLWFDGIWKNGGLTGGIWFDGIWKSGGWYYGRRKNGKWTGGVWLNGKWEYGEIWWMTKISPFNYYIKTKTSPKVWQKPKTTLSLNYAIYQNNQQ